MALLKYFKVEKRGPPLPNPSGLLNQQLSSSAIEEANKEVTAILCDNRISISWIFFLPFAIKLFSNNRCPIVLVYMITKKRAVGFEFGFGHALNARVKLVYSNLRTL